MGSPASPLTDMPDKAKRSVPDWAYRLVGMTPPAPPPPPAPVDTSWHDAQVKAANASFQKAAALTTEAHEYDSNKNPPQKSTPQKPKVGK